jgi:RimJ/RimL family protein N-acetyltransferase
MQSYGPAYRITTPRLVIRCWAPTDAPNVQRAIDASLRELRAFMPWAHAEPEPSDAKAERLRQFRGRFDLGQDFLYGVFVGDECVGGCGLHTRQGPTIREIGYWIATAHTKKGFATEVALALLHVALRVDRVPRVEIRCEPDNHASAAVAKKIGMKLEGTLRANVIQPDGSVRDTLLFAAIAADLDALPTLDVRAESATGERLL